MDKYTTEELIEMKKILEEYIEDTNIFVENLYTIESFAKIFSGRSDDMKASITDEYIDGVDAIDKEIKRRGVE